MDGLLDLLSWRYVVATIIAYYVTLAFYRLYLHPLARFPGPRLAAISTWYEGYYDIYQGGQYTFKIAQLHKQYGPIIRISPHELHVSDASFFEHLYRQDGRWDKYAWTVDAFGAKGATTFTADLDLHRARRQPLGPYFSKAKVAARQDLIQRHLEKLRGRVARYAGEGEKTTTTFDLGAAVTALARDVANEYILGKSYGSLTREDFDVAFTAMNAGRGARMWRVNKQVPWILPALRCVLMDWIVGMADEKTRVFFRLLQETMEDTKRLMAIASSSSSLDSESESDETETTTPRTIVHEIMASKLPATEKTTERVFEDVSTLAAAGFETTGSVLRLVLFHVYSNPDILKRLRDEIASVAGHDTAMGEISLNLNLRSLE